MWSMANNSIVWNWMDIIRYIIEKKMIIPPLSTRSVRTCNVCANYFTDDGDGRCTLNKIFRKIESRKDLDFRSYYWQPEDEPSHAEALQEWKCDSNFTEEELQELIDRHNKEEASENKVPVL